jgi:metallo-beta-lactamase family protein
MKNRPLEIEYFGGAGTVTGSSMLVRHSNKKGEDNSILLDHGSFVNGSNEEALAKNSQILIDSRGREVIPNLTAISLSHAHQDHIGRVLQLNDRNFEGRIYTTPETAMLMDPMLRDAAKIANANALTYNREKLRQALEKYIELKKPFRGRGRKDRGEKVTPKVKNPLTIITKFTDEDVDFILDRIHEVNYGERTKVAKGTYLTYLNAGHILGSAMSLIEADTGQRIVRLLNTHDLGNELKDSYLGQPEIPKQELDALAIEATYGDREHAERETVLNEMLEKMIKTLHDGGKVIIPAFALERSQEILMFLSQNLDQIMAGAGYQVPVYLDSRLGETVTGIYRRVLAGDEDMNQAKNDLGRILGAPNFKYLSNETRSAVNNSTGGAIIVSSSGMCDAGPVREHLLNNLSNPKNLILFIGYPGTGKTLANAILNASQSSTTQSVRINHEEVPVRAKTFYARAFSSHAGQSQLVRFVGDVNFKGENREQAKVLIQHCDPITGEALRERILNQFTDLRDENVQVAKTGTVYSV